MKIAELQAAKQLRATGERASRMARDTARRALRPLAPAAPPRAAPSRVKPEGQLASLKKINSAANVIQVGVAFRKGFATAQGEGKDLTHSLLAGAKDATVPVLTAAAPTIAHGAQHGAKLAADMTVKAARTMAHAKSEHVKAMLASGVVITGSSQVLLSAAKVAARFAMPINAAWGGFKGAQADTESRVRGFARGAITSLDPTAAFMDRGVVERGFDRAFGKAPEIKKEARTYQRTYTTGPKAGTTETVRLTQSKKATA